MRDVTAWGVAMLWKNAFIHTLREDPAEAELVSHKLMIRAGMIQRLASGIYNYLPPGLRVLRKIEMIIREEMTLNGASELLMPAVVPADLWKESGRWDYYGPELLRFKDRKGNDFCLGPTHEEVVVDVARHAVKSYRDLPLCLYQIQSKFRDEVRPRYGLMRGREFIMKDAYSFHADEGDLDIMYRKMYRAYSSIFSRCGLDFRPVEADSGTIGGDVTHEFHVLADSGEDTIAFCGACEYAANIERATSRYEASPVDVPRDSPAAEDVATPDKKSIEEVSSFLGVKPEQTVKMVVYEVNAGEYYAGVCIRGDLEVNEAKVRTALEADQIRIPEDDELRRNTGLAVGYLGAFGEAKKVLGKVVADYSVSSLADAVAGANREGYHRIHVYPSRDLRFDSCTDIGFVTQGDACPRCEAGTLSMRKGIEVGQVFKLGAKYSEPMGLTYLDDKGDKHPVTMGCYGIGVGRTAAAAIEQNYDKDGIVWPVSIAPFEVAVVCLDPNDTDVSSVAHSIHEDLLAQKVDVVLDDRDERPGVKFKDVDLIGIPVRVVVGGRGLKEGIVELKARSSKEVNKVPKDRIVGATMELLGALAVDTGSLSTDPD